jgi:hypothetical protein
METRESNHNKETTIMDVQSTSSDTPISSDDATSGVSQDIRLLPQNASSRPHSTGLNLRELSVSVLCQHCKDELDRLERGEPCHEQYSVELFHRALAQQDTFAREAVQRCFKETMHRWMHSHPHREAACRWESEEYYTALAFERFWQAAIQRQVTFKTLAEVLVYLRASLQGAVLDTLRTYSRPREASESMSGEAHVEDHPDGSAVWDRLQTMLPDEREQRLAYLLYHCGLGPREIVRLNPQEWSDVQEIFRLRRNILEQLLRNANRLGLVAQSLGTER